MSKKVYQIITDKILSLLEKDIVPWRKPWSRVGGQFDPLSYIPMNIRTKKSYRGGNIMLLWAQGYDMDATSRWWGTWKAWEEQKLAPREDQKSQSALCYVFRPIPVFEEGTEHLPMEDREVKYYRPFVRYHRVYNGSQIEGFLDPDGAIIENPDELPEFSTHLPSENIIAGYRSRGGPKITHGGNRAAYNPATDRIKMPKAATFSPPEEYYSTMFHEDVHSTGHKNRLDRAEGMNSISFGDHDYSFEELVAEMGAAMLCAVAKIDNKTIENSAAYIADWRKKLGEEPKWIIQAGAKAQKAVDHILGTEEWVSEDSA